MKEQNKERRKGGKENRTDVKKEIQDFEIMGKCQYLKKLKKKNVMKRKKDQRKRKDEWLFM